MFYRRRTRKKHEHTPLAARLVKRLVAAGAVLPEPHTHIAIDRHYHGHWQRSAGAWAWSLRWIGDPNDMSARLKCGDTGSQWPASMCAQEGTTIADHGYGHVVYPKDMA